MMVHRARPRVKNYRSVHCTISEMEVLNKNKYGPLKRV